MTNLEKLAANLTKEMRRTVRVNQEVVLDLGRMAEVWRDGVRVLDLIPDSLRKTVPYGSYAILNGVALYSGDRVVVAWVGSDPVVLGRLVST